MPNAKKPSPFCLRLSSEERARLERDAAGTSLGSYVRSRVFDPTVPPPRSRGKFPVKDQAALAKLLGLLGRSRIANNLNQLARAANMGTLSVTSETEADLRQTLKEIAELRSTLMTALGLQGGAE